MNLPFVDQTGIACVIHRRIALPETNAGGNHLFKVALPSKKLGLWLLGGHVFDLHE